MEIKTKTKYGLKDQIKAKIAQAYIGYGIEGSSTELYRTSAIEQKIPINEKIEPKAGLIIFASMVAKPKKSNKKRLSSKLLDVSKAELK